MKLNQNNINGQYIYFHHGSFAIVSFPMKIKKIKHGKCSFLFVKQFLMLWRHITDYLCASIGSKIPCRTNSINMNSNNRVLSSFDFFHDYFVRFSDSSLLTSNVVELYLFCSLFQLYFIQLKLLIATIKRWQSHCFNFVSIFCLRNNFIITVTLQNSEWKIQRVLLWLWC